MTKINFSQNQEAGRIPKLSEITEKRSGHGLHFQSRLGFILLAAGCAIGLGNVWRFPYMVYKNGGAIFVLVYLLCLLIIGLPVMLCEFAVGRMSRSTAIKSFSVLQPKKTYKWPWVGYLALIGCLILLSYYAMIAGWMVDYVVGFAHGRFADVGSWNTFDPAKYFTYLLSDPGRMIVFTAIVILICLLICSLGFNRGVEKLNKGMMSLLFIILIVLAVVSMQLKEAPAAMKFYLLPNLKHVQSIGWTKVIFDALNQAFFTLSLGVSAMAIFASRIGRERTLLNEAVQIGVLDTLVAVLSGFIIFPAAFTFNIPADEGPNLIFVTLPRIFQAMSYGRYFAVAFFVFMTFAALSTLLAVLENIVSCLVELTGRSRKLCILLTGVIVFCLNIPNILGFNIWSTFKPFGFFDNIMDLSDFIVSANILPLGSLFYLFFCVTRYGIGFDAFLNEVNMGRGLKLPKTSRLYFKYVLPIIIILIYVMAVSRLF